MGRAALCRLRLGAERVVRARADKAVRVLFHRLGGVFVLKAEELPLQKHSLFNAVFVHDRYQIVGGETISESFGDHLKFAAVGIARSSPSDSAQLPARGKTCNILHDMRVRVDNLHCTLLFYKL